MERTKDIEIFRKNHSTVIIQCNQIISNELYNYFSAYATNYRFAPLYKSKQWDGKIRFFKLTDNSLPIGLVEKVYEFAKKGNYSVSCNYERFNVIDQKEFINFVFSLNVPFEVRSYQLDAAYQAITKKNINIHISTSGGKSLVIYLIVRFMHYIKSKSLIIVPNVQLVEQLFSDFESYGWNPEKYCHRIYAGQKKFYESSCIIACWQSMISTKVKKDNPYEDFGCLIIDEAHGAKGQSLQELSKICINSEYRIGFSGTYPENTIADWYSIVGSLGPIQTFATYKTLQEDGHIAKLKIYSIILTYSKEFKRKIYNECGKDYTLQNDTILNSIDRNDFILKMVNQMDKNCLILFTKKEKHGIPLYEYFKEHLQNKMILYIDGDVPIDQREDVRKIMESNNNVVLLATYGCLSTGVSINNLHNIIFASGYKSKTKVFQSIGRSLRLNHNKEYAKLYDIVDDCSFIDRTNNIKFINHSMNHYKERKQLYLQENWQAKEIKIKIDN